MSNKISEKAIEDIRLHNDIVETVSGYIPLKPAGQNYKALCPFHNEKTPSFIISPSKQIFHCFGCHAGGNVFSFVMQMEKVSFIEAVKLLGRKAGIKIHLDSTSDGEDKEALFEVMKSAADFFHNQLLKERITGAALSYLNKRSFTDEIIENFKLGYASGSGNGLIQFLKNEGFSLDVMKRAGLVGVKSGQKEYFEWFRGRIMFPIFDVNNRIIGFGGRAIGDAMPKYINSPDTPLFSKSRILYGLNYSKREIIEKKQAIVVEGYIDFIRLFSAGIRNCVAALGTAFTEIHARLLKRYVPETVMAFDSDRAGAEAAFRAFEIFLENGLKVKIVPMPPGEDPDSYIIKEGVNKFREIVENAQMMLDYKLKYLMHQYDCNSEAGKTFIADRMLATIAKIENAVGRDYYLEKLSQELGVSQAALSEELDKIFGKNKKRVSAPTIEKSSGRGGDNVREMMLLRLLLLDSKAGEFVFSKLEEDELFDMDCRSIFSVMKEVYSKKNVNGESIISRISDVRLQGLVSEMLIQPMDNIDIKKALDETVTSIKRFSINNQMENLLKEIKKRETNGEDIFPLLKKLQEMRKTIAFL